MIEPPNRPVLFDRLPLTERTWVVRVLRDETVGGLLLVAAAVVALVWANSPWGDSYAALTSHVVSIGPLHLDLTLQQWAADGLLAVFFFIAGVELKHELVLGSLSRPSRAAVPVAAALGGMVVPAGIYVAVNLTGDAGSPGGWGIPMATDIAFALAVLAIAGRALPVALRAFLLTLAVVDDLGAIIVIALFYSKGFSLGWFAAAVAACVAYWLLQRARVRSPFVYVPLVLATWFFVHDSGVHATIAGVALGLLTRVRRDPGEEAAPTERMEHLLRPLSAGLCVPLFAFFSAGVDLRGEGLSAVLSPVGLGVLLGLVVGKPVGVLGAAWLTARFTRASLNPSLRWADIGAVGTLAGIGFTVSLLIAELAFDGGSPELTAAKAAILAASVIAAVLASGVLWLRRRAYASMHADEELDDDGDGIPDVYQRDHG